MAWFKVTFVLIFVSSFIVVAIGYALNAVHKENAALSTFLNSSQNVQTDFENSLAVYTENTQKNLMYLSSLRPQNESDYIAFITQVEDLAQEDALTLDLSTLDESAKPDTTGSFYIDYQLKFNANQDQLWHFTTGLETLPYFTRVMQLSYKSLEDGEEEDFLLSNVDLILRLYVK